MSFQDINLYQNGTPIVSPGDTVIVPFTFVSTGIDSPGSRIHAIAPKHCHILAMSVYSPSKVVIAEDGLSSNIINANGGGWNANRSITLSVDADAPDNTVLSGGSLTYYSSENVPGSSCPLLINTGAEIKPITVSYEKRGSWQDWETQQWIYSYRINLTSAKTNISNWLVAFDNLPAGSEIVNPQTLWVTVLANGTEGTVVLEAPQEGTHIIMPDTILSIDIEIKYSSTDNDVERYSQLYNLIAYDLTEV